MKKKINSSLKFINNTLILILWGLSMTLTFYMLVIFGWKINHPYNKKKEQKYRKRIDIMCHIILSIWCLLGLINLNLYGPFFTIYYGAQNIVYIVLTLMTINIWLDRKYHNDKKSRNILVVISVWNIIMYPVSDLILMSSGKH